MHLLYNCILFINLVNIILESSTMAATDSGFMEVMTGNPHLEMVIIASYSYLSNTYFDRYCAMAALFSSFPPDKWRRILPTQILSLAVLENYCWLSEADIETRFPYFEFVWT